MQVHLGAIAAQRAKSLTVSIEGPDIVFWRATLRLKITSLIIQHDRNRNGSDQPCEETLLSQSVHASVCPFARPSICPSVLPHVQNVSLLSSEHYIQECKFHHNLTSGIIDYERLLCFGKRSRGFVTLLKTGNSMPPRWMGTITTL